MSKVIVGKHTLESLTSGMYSDPYVVFREYIQNAADSIDEAVGRGILNKDDGQITICISPVERRISIFDNGSGICVNSAEKTLVSIGNSKKASDNSRGFRGIGRLAALSYCATLTFETSAFTEKFGTRITIDAKRLAELLMYDDGTEVSAADVLKDVYCSELYQEKNNTHYFRVYLDGVDESSGLENYESVITYIRQNAPVPYDPVAFVWGKEIDNRLKQEGIKIQSYNVFVTFGSRTTQIFKPYTDEFLVDKGKSITDTIKDIDIVKICKKDGVLLAIGWIAKTDYLGSIYDKSIKGIRLRKGNIMIGDNQTMNVVFRDARFNGWSIGEIFALDVMLIPNARRDNFEKNPAYFLLLEHMMTIASGIAKDIRSASLARNNELSNVLCKTETVIKSADEAIINGLSSTEKGKMKLGLTNTQEMIVNTRTHDETGSYYQEVAFEELDMLIGKLQGVTSYKALNMMNHLDKTEKRILERVFNIIIATDEDNSKAIINAILESFM